MCRLSRSLLLVCLLVGLIHNLAEPAAADPADPGYSEVCVQSLVKAGEELYKGKGYPQFHIFVTGDTQDLEAALATPAFTTKYEALKGLNVVVKKELDTYCISNLNSDPCTTTTFSLGSVTPLTVGRECKKRMANGKTACAWPTIKCKRDGTEATDAVKGHCTNENSDYAFLSFAYDEGTGADNNCWESSWRLGAFVKSMPTTTQATTTTKKAPPPPPPPTLPAPPAVDPNQNPIVNPEPQKPVTSGPLTTPFLPYGGVETAPMTEAPSVNNAYVAPAAAANEDSTTEAADRRHLCELFVGSWLLMCYAFH